MEVWALAPWGAWGSHKAPAVEHKARPMGDEPTCPIKHPGIVGLDYSRAPITIACMYYNHSSLRVFSSFLATVSRRSPQNKIRNPVGPRGGAQKITGWELLHHDALVGAACDEDADVSGLTFVPIHVIV